MQYIGYAAAALLGFALGLFGGRLLNALIFHWENAESAVKQSIALFVFLLGGGGGGAWIFKNLSGPDEPKLYLLALALALVLAFFGLGKVPQYSFKTIKYVVDFSDELRKEIPDPKNRALLILTSLATPKMIERATGIDEADLAGKLEGATDALAKQLPRT